MLIPSTTHHLLTRDFISWRKPGPSCLSINPWDAPQYMKRKHILRGSTLTHLTLGYTQLLWGRKVRQTLQRVDQQQWGKDLVSNTTSLWVPRIFLPRIRIYSMQWGLQVSLRQAIIPLFLPSSWFLRPTYKTKGNGGRFLHRHTCRVCLKIDL